MKRTQDGGKLLSRLHKALFYLQQTVRIEALRHFPAIVLP
jgi:hypothetical protein